MENYGIKISRGISIIKKIRNAFEVTTQALEWGTALSGVGGVAKGVYVAGRAGYNAWKIRNAFVAAERLAVAKIPAIALDSVTERAVQEALKTSTRKRFAPSPTATGAHTVFRNK